METFGKKLSELRKQKGMSQEDLAFDLNISQSSISNYESGSTHPDVETLRRMADYFKVPITYFFSDEKVFFHTNENHGGNSGYMINSTLNVMSEKLIELYEDRIKLLEKELELLKKSPAHP